MSEQGGSPQARNHGRTRMFALLACLTAVFALAGCGKRPGAVEPPPDAGGDHFPQTYPDPATDPPP